MNVISFTENYQASSVKESGPFLCDEFPPVPLDPPGCFLPLIEEKKTILCDEVPLVPLDPPNCLFPV